MPSAPTANHQTTSPLAASRQLILVTSFTWNSTTARLQRFERASLAFDWQPSGNAINVCIGRSGLAWGIGLHVDYPANGPTKREGDGCAPAGIFAITALFGDAGLESQFAKSARLPYLRATQDLKGIDDPASQYYNRIVDQRCVDAIDWASHEEMLRSDERYAIGAVIAHNSEPPVPDAGSCIFMHVWQNEDAPTAGCTAASLADMTEICRWLDGAANPLLVQLPQPEYLRLREAWALPALAE